MKNFREVYPNGTICCKVELVSELVKLNVTIETGPIDGNPSVKLVDMDSLAHTGNFESVKKKALVEALMLAGVIGLEESTLKGKEAPGVLPIEAHADKAEKKAEEPVVEDLPAVIDVDEPKQEAAEDLPAVIDGDQTDAAPGPVEDQPKPRKAKKAKKVETKVEETSEVEAVAAEDEHDVIPAVEPAQTETPETVPEPEPVQPDAPKEEVSETGQMTLEEAEACILTVQDEAMKSRMGDFVGKPMKLIAEQKPSLLRFMCRKSNGLFTPECMEAANILYLATK